MMTQASNELETLSEKFGKDFDKYLLKELIEQIDLKDAVKAQKDKSEPFKVQLLNQELARCSQKPEFLLYFSEIAQQSFNDRVGDFLNELTKRLRLSFPNQLLVALSIVESAREDSQTEVIKILRQKLVDYHNYGRPELLPEYAVHRLLYLLSTHPELKEDESLKDIVQYIIDSNPLKQGSHVSLRPALQQDLMFANTTQEEPSISLIKEGNGLDNLDKSYKMLEPWQILNDLGHFCSYNYNYLVKTLDDFKEINERTMARTLLNLSVNHTGYDDMTSRIVYTTFEANKKGDSTGLKKEVSDKKTQMNWSIDNLARAFRELYSNLNWQKVFEALSEIEDDITLDAKAFQTFISLFNKSKPQNLQYPLSTILSIEWANPSLQINFIDNSIQFYIEKKEKSIMFAKTERRQEMIEEITGIKDKVAIEILNVWLSVDLVERLIILSDSHQFQKVRNLFEFPMKTVPDYLLLTLSQAKPSKGNLMIDELLSLLLPQFLGNHINSIPVLQALWNNNKALMIRGICELCRHDQRIMNLSRVLDITQEVKESLIPIVNCEDYYFAVNLGILAGKRDFLHYDVWLQGRILEVGTPFIKALNKYVKEHIIMPIIEYQKKHTNPQTGTLDITPEQLEYNKLQILERSHLSREKLCITIEHLSNQQNRSNQKIKEDTIDQIRDVVTKIGEFFPSQVSQIQNSEEIDNAANDYFQKVFSADASQVDQKIIELIETMQRFKESDVKKEQEIYACMLHSLFDEYRFLHRYPQQYLEKIAKLFGAIIKYRIIDGTLHDIALKFAYEAFRREGKRQKFGVITIKQFFDMLPQFPSFFEEIYEIRQNIHSTDPAMIKEIEDLYEKTMKKGREEDKKGNDDHKKDDDKKGDLGKLDKKNMDTSVPITNINKEIFLSTFTNNVRNPQAAAPSQQEIPMQASRSANVQPSASLQKPQAQNQQSLDQQHQQQQIIRNSTPSQTTTTSQVFIPTYKQPRTEVAQQPSTQQQTAQAQQQQIPGENSNLNVASAVFKKQSAAAPVNNLAPTISAPQQSTQSLQQQQQQQQQQQMQNQNQINMMSRVFRPTSVRSPAPPQIVNQQVLQMQTQIDAKLQKALTENAKIRIEDIIEDSSMPGPTPEVQEQIKFICNNTGKGNFAQKLEELKALITQNALPNLNWFIHYVLTKRISSQSTNLHPIYIDLIKQINNKESTSLTISQIVDIFKRCMLIDEELFLRIAQRPSSQGSPIKQFLINLGAFLGGLTVASSRPILAKELDIKQLLVEGYSSEKLKYVVTFVCRIFKECSKSNIFKPQNPWIKANLEILREIYDSALNNNMNNQQNEILMEIDALCRSLNINNINEINHCGFLKASQTQQYQSSSQQVEVQHLMNKNQLIPAVQPPVVPQQQQQVPLTGFARPPNMSPSPNPLSAFNIFQQPGRLMTPNSQGSEFAAALSSQNQQQQQQQLQQQMIHNQQQIFPRVVVSPEILQILGRSATSKEQLLRKMVADAVDSSIVEILPPVVDRSVTIALITTRELVLKDFAFDGNFSKILKAADLIVQNLAGSLALVTCREPLKMSLNQNLKRSLQQLNSQIQADGEVPLNEGQISDIASLASRENLELGCKLIKKSVIQKALTKVREDPQIMRAIEARKSAQNLNVPYYQDENLIAQFKDLPPQLKPNTNGLTDAQFQVYEDFARLSISSKKQSDTASTTDASSVGGKSLAGANAGQIGSDSAASYDIETYLKQFERQQALDEVIEYQLNQKLKQMNTDQDPEEQAKLWNFCKKWFFIICEKFNSPDQQDYVNALIEGLAFIVQRYKADDLQKKLCQQLMSFDTNVVSNLELTLTLMKKGIISIVHWDSSIALFLRDTQQFSMQEQFFGFIKEFLEQSITKQKLFGYHQLPNLIAILEKISENPNVGKFFSNILEDLKSKTAWNKDTLREYFNEWAVMSFEESNPRQEQEVNRFFNNLQQMGLYKDSEIMYNFCKVMVEVSIERALFAADGVKRPQDRLDYRYIESFLKLMVVLLKTSDINKHEFMSKLFEAIHEVLDEDHKNKKSEFNQKPYYRLLINILTAVNNSQFFNPKTHLLILFSLADLFNKLNPNKYPAFSFAWLELICHKQFMPHFLQAQPPANAYPVSQQQPQRKGAANQQQLAAQQQQLQQSQVHQDNTFYQKWFKFKELIVNLFTFLKNNMIIGQKLSVPLVKYYEATLRTVLVIRHDYPEFLCDFHFNFVNSLPEHCIQLKNVILSAQPRSIPMYNPFSKNLKVDTLQEINNKPRMQSNYDNYLSLMNLREDLEKYFRTKNQSLIQVICDKMMQSEEIINGRRKINSSIINAVALFIGNFAVPQSKSQQINQKECYEMLKKIILNLNPETRLCLLNSLVNELRYINSYTYFYSWIVIFLFSDNDETIQEQITRILIERLQVHEPHPWGLCITFRELLQNPKYQFAKKSFIVQNQPVIEQLLQTRLSPFYTFWQNQKQAIQSSSQHQHHNQAQSQNNGNQQDQNNMQIHHQQ